VDFSAIIPGISCGEESIAACGGGGVRRRRRPGRSPRAVRGAARSGAAFVEVVAGDVTLKEPANRDTNL